MMLSSEPLRIAWSSEAEQYFAAARIFLCYPWRIRKVFKLGQTVSISRAVKAEPYACMPRGSFASFGAFTYSRSNALPVDFRAGRYCSIAPGVTVSDAEHPLDRYTTHVCTYRRQVQALMEQDFGIAPKLYRHGSLARSPDIGSDVWIGAEALIKRGIKIGHGAVIGARALVTKDVPPYAIVGGTPAKVIRYRFSESIIERMLALEWWRYNFVEFSELAPTNIEAFIDELERRRDVGNLKPLKDNPVSIADGLERHLRMVGAV